jgi:AcrR family transcriptional regulator
MSGRLERRKERTRRALLDAALQLFADRGVYDARVEDITEAADLGKGAFYNYFDGKSGLIAELLAEALGALADRCDQAVAGLDDTVDRTRRILSEHERFFDENRAYPLLVHQARGLVQLDPSSAQRMRHVFRLYLDRVGSLLYPPSEPGDVSDDDRIAAASVLAGAVAGYRSFCVAAGVQRRPRTTEDVLCLGIHAVGRGTRSDE